MRKCTLTVSHSQSDTQTRLHSDTQTRWHNGQSDSLTSDTHTVTHEKGEISDRMVQILVLVFAMRIFLYSYVAVT